MESYNCPVHAFLVLVLHLLGTQGSYVQYGSMEVLTISGLRQRLPKAGLISIQIHSATPFATLTAIDCQQYVLFLYIWDGSYMQAIGF